MGIPSYFSYIIKNYSNIIRNIQYHREKETRFDSLYMDCNSIIYDSFHLLNKNMDTQLTQQAFETLLINTVIEKICEYVNIIKPTNVLYIAFDGVAPFAKMDQQRSRRYKSWYTTTIDFLPKTKDTSFITPGTQFMDRLGVSIRSAFKSRESLHGVREIIVSAADVAGEGEHKMFQHIRDTKDVRTNENIAVYGLDADLIMLSIFHRELCSNIYVCREAPEFMSSKLTNIDNADEKDLLYMDIHELTRCITHQMDCNDTTLSRVYDYIFICFMLGNDFMPHFPALNIRTTGTHTLLDAYRIHIGAYPDRYLINKETMNINWKWVNLYISHLATAEHQLILNEHKLREKFDHQRVDVKSPTYKQKLFETAPTVYRVDEEYICPKEKMWEHRYYRTLFNCEYCENRDISINYLQGLEWVFKYYTQGCPDWRWKYNYNYPPLLADLVKYIPHFDTTFIHADDKMNVPFSPLVQLSYVIPPAKHSLLPDHIHKYLSMNCSKYYTYDVQFQMAYCRYFWESHILLPEIPIELLDAWGKQFA